MEELLQLAKAHAINVEYEEDSTFFYYHSIIDEPSIS